MVSVVLERLLIKQRVQRREDNGRFDFDSNLDRLCVCGHRLGDHAAGTSPKDCLVYSFPETDRAKMYNGDKPNCGCMKFRQSRRKVKL